MTTTDGTVRGMAYPTPVPLLLLRHDRDLLVCVSVVSFTGVSFVVHTHFRPGVVCVRCEDSSGTWSVVGNTGGLFEPECQ